MANVDAPTWFLGDLRFLSNFQESGLELDGKWYITVEHAYQASKTLDPKQRQAIRLCKTPTMAKRLGQKLDLRTDWEKIKVNVMLELLRQKFGRYPVLRNQLLATGDRELVENNDWGDVFWGMVDGTGQNWLGKLLMQVRQEIRDLDLTSNP